MSDYAYERLAAEYPTPRLSRPFANHYSLWVPGLEVQAGPLVFRCSAMSGQTPLVPVWHARLTLQDADGGNRKSYTISVFDKLIRAVPTGLPARELTVYLTHGSGESRRASIQGVHTCGEHEVLLGLQTIADWMLARINVLG